MSQLRNLLIQLHEEDTLKKLLGNEYEIATSEHKDYLLDISRVRNQISIDVDVMLHEYVLSYQQNTPEAAKDNKLKWIYIFLNIVLSTGSAYAVNEEAWVFVTLLSCALLATQRLPFVYK